MSRKPLGVKTQVTFDEIWGRALREGIGNGWNVFSAAVVSPSSGQTVLGAVGYTPCYHLLIQSATLSSSGETGIALLAITGAKTNSDLFQHYVNNRAVNVPMNAIVYAGTTGAVFLRNGDGATSLKVSASMACQWITADLNFNAEKVILWVGDSISAGTVLLDAGATTIATPTDGTATFAAAANPMMHYAFQVRDHFKDRGIDCRLVLKAIGGYDSVEMEWWRKQGWLDIEQADLIVYQMGVNDAIAGSGTVSDATYQSNLEALVSWRDRQFPDAKILFLGSTPLNDNTNETRLSELRTIMNAVATAESENEVYYLSLASSFDRTTLTNYTNSDGIHPDVDRNVLIANVINNWITAEDFEF